MEAILYKLIESANTALLVIIVLQVWDLRESIKELQKKMNNHIENFSIHCSPEKFEIHLTSAKNALKD